MHYKTDINSPQALKNHSISEVTYSKLSSLSSAINLKQLKVEGTTQWPNTSSLDMVELKPATVRLVIRYLQHYGYGCLIQKL